MPVHAAEAVGRYTYAADGGWWWSETMHATYGPDASPVDGPETPGVERLLHRVPEDDHARVRDAFTACVSDGTSFAVSHRVHGPEGGRRRVTLTGSRERTDDGRPRVGGFVLDVEEAVAAAAKRDAQLQLGTALASHALIDQAKGALMLVYGIEEQEAFDLLRWSSMRLNVKLALLAQRVVAVVRDAEGLAPSARDALERALHEPAAEPRRRVDRGEVTTTPYGPHGPVVTVTGRVDLRVARQLAEAITATWSEARGQGGLVVDLERTAEVGAAARHLLAGTVRRAESDRLRVRVVVPVGDPARLVGVVPARVVRVGSDEEAVRRRHGVATAR
ncbi:ANTAR domain-containing protein [Cellulomonas fimi]|uniref:ANTAR domain-containing protein n=1 Tax=Cellulomonas fimi TaxID=1708 RepID=UPI00234E28D6|nr:ANTAR domain-containing protein [Cellulomonas fimi]MDC7122762.1 ANTAR domain-containing protein [Cellulomonas fimi]